MKKLLLFLFIYMSFNFSVFSQCNECNYKSDEIWISIENNQKFVRKNGLMIVNDTKLDSVLRKYGTHEIKQVFPYSKIDRLKKLYKIKFQGERDNFILELQKNKSIKRISKRPVENHVAAYDPSDYMWYLPTQQDTNGWLWHLKRIHAAQAWDITKGDPNIKVASLDTWFDVNHPDLTNKISPKYDPYSNTSYNSDCFRTNHGTTAASFIAAETDGGGQLASIGFNCMLICYQAWAGDYIERAQHAALAMHADVITSSAGGWTCTSTINEDEKIALKEILDNGTIVVMPAGNGPNGTNCNYGGRDHPWKPLSPDYDERVIIVTSTGIDDNHYYFNPDHIGIDGNPDPREETHSHYPEVDICAPGYRVMGATCTESNINGNCEENTWPYYGSCTGTSFATPIVAGVCALMKTVNPCITPTEAQDIIKSTADPVNDANLYTGMVGAGRINAYRCVKEAATNYIQNETLSGTQTIASHIIEAGNHVTNSETTGDVTVQNGANITFSARHEVTLDSGFEVVIGAELTIDVDENNSISCN